MKLNDSKLAGSIILILLAIISYLLIAGIDNFGDRIGNTENEQAKIDKRVVVLETEFKNITSLIEEIRDDIKDIKDK